MTARYLINSALAAVIAVNAFAWGQKGHDVTTYIAENHFTNATKDSISDILDGKSIVYWANWLDNASHTPEYAYSKTWHYKNIDDGQSFEKAPKIKEGDIVRTLENQIKILSSHNASKEEKALALKITVHLLGDIHQPMHLGHASDRGGNRWNVKNFNRSTNLHSSWDSFLPEQAHKWSYTEWQSQIDRLSESDQIDIIQGGTPESWAKETFEICKQIYASTPEGTNLAYDYVAEWTPIIEQQFLRGGIRLADLLNSIFDSNYSGKNNAVSK